MRLTINYWLFMARRPEPISGARLPQLYADMVVRVHELCIGLIGQAQAGNEQGVLTEAERLAAQAGALVNLLAMKRNKKNNEGGK